MQSILTRIGSKFSQGSLEFRAADGRVWTLGQHQPRAVIRLNDPDALPGIVLNPRMRFPEAYMEGAWDPMDGDLLQVLEVALRMVDSAKPSRLGKLAGDGLAFLGELNNPLKSRSNVHAHYDLDYDLYSRFLDRDLHYSCAYFSNPDMGLEAAQQAKCAHIAAKLDLRPGARVLDIGCG